MERDGWPDWGRLIDEARDRAGISQNAAARRAEITGTHWRKIVKGEVGEMASDRGLRTVARMAHAAGLTHEDFKRAAVRHDVMNVMLNIEVEQGWERGAQAVAESTEIIERIERRLRRATRPQLEAFDQWAETWLPDVDHEDGPGSATA